MCHGSVSEAAAEHASNPLAVADREEVLATDEEAMVTDESSGPRKPRPTTASPRRQNCPTTHLSKLPPTTGRPLL